jgi:hypothetical protein
MSLGRTNTQSIVTPRVMVSNDLLRLQLAESLAADPPALTRREVRLPGIPGKTLALIGVAGCDPRDASL